MYPTLTTSSARTRLVVKVLTAQLVSNDGVVMQYSLLLYLFQSLLLVYNTDSRVVTLIMNPANLSCYTL